MVAVVLSASGVYIMLTLVILPTHHQCCCKLQASAGHGGFRVLLENYRVSYTPTQLWSRCGERETRYIVHEDIVHHSEVHAAGWR